MSVVDESAPSFDESFVEPSVRAWVPPCARSVSSGGLAAAGDAPPGAGEGAGRAGGGGGGEAWAADTPVLVTVRPVAAWTEAVSARELVSALVSAVEPGGVVTVVVEVMPVTLELVIDRPSTAAAEIGTVSPAP